MQTALLFYTSLIPSVKLLIKTVRYQDNRLFKIIYYLPAALKLPIP